MELTITNLTFVLLVNTSANMADDFPGTAAWLRGQWSNPSDIFTILLIIGGDIVRVAVAQLCAGPVPYLTPVSFSFGWVGLASTSFEKTSG